MHRLRFNMEENMKSRVDILEWEFEKKANIMKQEN